jgi:hypothetical protein
MRDADASEADATGARDKRSAAALEPEAAADAEDDQAAPEAEPRAARGRAMQPAPRRQAALRLLALWRDLGRDLALAAAGARAEISRLDLVDELERAAMGLDRGGIAAFLGRVDVLAGAIDAYANPDLVVDVLALAWPRPEAAEAAA